MSYKSVSALRRSVRSSSIRAASLTLFSALGASVFLAPHAYAQSYTFITIDIPFARSSEATGVNNSGNVVGEYQNVENNEIYGFVYNISSGTYSIEGPPNPGATDPVSSANGISNLGVIVGDYGDNLTTDTHGYIDNGGTYTYPVSDSNGPNHTTANGINDSGEVVGTYNANVPGSFIYQETGGTYTNFSDPSAGVGYTYAEGINDSGAIVGSYQTSSGLYGFVDNAGAFTTLNDPNSTFGGSSQTGPNTSASGINNSGTIVGSYTDSSGNQEGYVYSSSAGTYTTLDEPDEVNAGPEPGTELYGINDSGDIVGAYSNGSVAAFVAIPNSSGSAAPEPGAGVLLLLGIAPAFGLAARRRLCRCAA